MLNRTNPQCKYDYYDNGDSNIEIYKLWCDEKDIRDMPKYKFFMYLSLGFTILATVPLH